MTPDRKLQRVLVPLALSFALAGLSGCAGNLDRAQSALAVGDEAVAEEQLRKALSKNPSDKEAARLLSVLLAKQGERIAASQPRPAELKFTEALELDPTNEQARVDLARLMMKRGFMADARELLAAKDCRSCGRLIGLMLHEEADKARAAGEIGAARLAYQQAFEVGNDPIDALGLAETYLVDEMPDLGKARELLQTAAPLIARGQTEAETKFQQLRAQYLMAAAATGQAELVRAGFDIRSPALAEEPEFDLRFKVAQEQFRKGYSDPAIESIGYLLENASQYLEPTQREVMSAALVVMYSARAAQHLGAGDAAGAARDIADARKIDGDNNRLKLQQVLAIAANGRIPMAFETLSKDATKGKDTDQVKAILHSMEVFEALEAGSVAKAQGYLDQAEQLAADLPEVRLARAYVLAELRNEDLKKKAIGEARSAAGFDYPGGRINQYPGALANLDRARKRLAEQGGLHPFRGPEFARRADELSQKLKAFYPYAVSWYGADGGVIQLTAEGGQKEVAYSGPRYLKGTAIASPGKPAEIPVPNVGLVYLQIDGKQVGVVVEQNTFITLAL